MIAPLPRDLSELSLSDRLAEFLECAVDFKLMRAQQSTLKSLFRMKEGAAATISGTVSSSHTLDSSSTTTTGSIFAQLESAAETRTEEFDQRKDGVLFDDFFRWGSILEEHERGHDAVGLSSFLKKKWVCERCEQEFKFSKDEVTAHRLQCASTFEAKDATERLVQQERERAEEDEQRHKGEPRAAPQHHFCEQCNRSFFLLPTEILKHVKTHQQPQQQKPSIE
jgi:hypothetical protein